MLKNKILTIIVCLAMVSGITGCSTSSNAKSDNKTEIVSVKNHKITIKAKEWSDDGKTLTDTTYKGKYTGKMKNKKPYGKGKFVSENSDNIKWTYKGEFKNGTFNGQGTTTWEKNKITKISKIFGTYKDGAFTPTKADYLQNENAYYQNTKISGYHQFTMSDKGMDFFKNHQNYFPVDMNNPPEDYASNIAGSFDYPQASKNIDSFEDKLYQVQNLYVRQIYETYVCGQPVTEMLGVDTNSDIYYYYTILYFGSTNYVEGDTVNQIIFLPQCEGTFDDTEGGTTWCMFIIASEID